MDRKLVFVVNSQQEYWSREFNGEVLAKDNLFKETLLQLISKQIIPIVQLDDDLEELKFFSSLPPNSIIGWCASDETYNSRFNHKIARLKCLALVLRPYKLSPPSMRNFFNALVYSISNLKEATSFKDVGRLIAWQVRGIRLVFRQVRIILDFKVKSRRYINIPIGYTNIFAKSLSRFANAEDGISLFNLSATYPPDAQKSSISFTGQSGQIVREVAIRALEKEDSAQVIRRSGYGASNVLDSEVTRNGDEYLRNLLDSAFVLCPPGNISGETFRLFETTVIQRLPLFMPHVTSDPNFKSSYRCGSVVSKSRSWSVLIKGVASIDPSTYNQLIRLNTEKSLNLVEKLRNYLLDGNFSKAFTYRE